MANIRLDLDHEIIDGLPVTFAAPCDCTAITGLKVYHPDGSKVFVFKDAHGNTLTGIGNLFAKGAYVKAVLDTNSGAAYIQNADTNAYLEAQLASKAPAGYGYGEALSTIAASTEIEFEAALSVIADAMPNHTTKQVKAILSFLGHTTFSVVELYKHSSGNQVLVTIRSPRDDGTNLQKVYLSASGWKPIEWYNPPMLPGIEYRTIEIYNGDPVYRKLIVLEYSADVGSSDGLTLGTERIVHNLAFDKIVEVKAFAYCADGDIVPFQIDKITDMEFVIDTSHGVWKKPTYEITIAYTKP